MSVPVWLCLEVSHIAAAVCDYVLDTNQSRIGGIDIIELAYHHYLVIWLAKVFDSEGWIVKDMLTAFK
jgi:hypothetical protein